MRLFNLLAAGLLPCLSIAAKDRFADYNAKAFPLKMNDNQWDELTKAPRDYTVAVLLTAMDAKFGCGLCQEFQPDWEIMTKSWKNGDKKAESRVIFGTLDFEDGKNTFQSLMLNTAPIIYLFRPTTGPHAEIDTAPIKYDFGLGVSNAETVHEWMSRQLPDRPHPPIVRPINWVKNITITTAVLGIITFGAVAAPYAMPVLQSRNLWAALSLLGVLLFTSGYMFNHIRKVPYVMPNRQGGISYFAGGFQNQFGMETQIVAVLYGVLAFAAISLSLKAPRVANAKSQQVAVFLWSAVMFLTYGWLMHIFKIKNGGYPFFLPPF